MKKRISTLLLTLLLVGAAQAATSLPKAEAIIDKFIEASGGQEALTRYQTAHATGTFTMPAMGIHATMEVWQEAPDKRLTVMVSDAFGTISEGFNGEVAWESAMMTGAKVKDGVEGAISRRGAQFNPWVNWKKLYQKAETVGSEAVDEVDCWKVVLTPNEGEGEPETMWFAKDSGLLLKSATTMKNEMGIINVEAYASDYQEVQGITMAMTSRQVLMGMQEIILTTEKHEFGVEIPAGTFALPDEVKALVEANN